MHGVSLQMHPAGAHYENISDVFARREQRLTGGKLGVACILKKQ